MINGYVFMYFKLKLIFWLNFWKLVFININGIIVYVYGECLVYGVFVNDCYFLLILNNFIII